MCERVLSFGQLTEVDTDMGPVKVIMESEEPATGGILNVTGFAGCAIEAATFEVSYITRMPPGELQPFKLPCKKCKKLVKFELALI